MAGVRIRHHTRRSQMLPVPLLFEPWPDNRTECGLCHAIHPCKVIHLDLDDTGALIVSPEIKEQVFRVGGFHVVNTVAKPPTQNVAPATMKLPIQGIEIGGGLEKPEPNTRYATVTSDNLPDEATVSLEEYVTIAERNGITMETALNVLIAHILGMEGNSNGDNRNRRTSQRSTR